MAIAHLMHPWRRQPGQVLAFFALVVPIVLLPVAAYAVDASVYAAAAARLQQATALAAEAAAQQVDAPRLRAGGGIGLDSAAARAAAQGSLALSDPAAALEELIVAGTDVTITTAELVPVPLAVLGPASIRVKASASARLATGYARPSSRLPLPTSTF
jgi:hypothetical protein